MTTVQRTETGADPDDRTAAIVAEAHDWFEANWSEDLALGEWWDRIGRSGWGFPGWPERWFGRGLPSGVARAVTAERLRMGVFGPVSSISTFLAAPTILAHGTDEQKERFLPGIATGRDVWCQLFSEPGAGSDMASLQTRAVRDGDEWVVTGQKVWNSGAQYARYGILIARTDPDVPKHKGITYFLHRPRAARRRRAAAAGDDRRGRLQRGLPQRGPGPRRQPAGRPGRGLAGGDDHPGQRARPREPGRGHRRRQRDRPARPDG